MTEQAGSGAIPRVGDQAVDPAVFPEPIVMYSRCMYCTKSLGANEVVETFPVGRRLAFDAARGRLWVICTRCERWNLTPLEERWEAVETCERIFRGTRVRVSTENIGIARHPEGLKLVRIGEPLRPEFAAWRYGDQFGRRRRKHLLYGAAATVAVGGVYVGGFAVGLVTLGTMGAVNLPLQVANWWMQARTLVKLHPDGGQVIKLRRTDLDGTRIHPSTTSPASESRFESGGGRRGTRAPRPSALPGRSSPG